MSKNITDPSLKKLFELVPGAQHARTLESVTGFIDQGGSVFDMLKLGHRGVVETFGLDSADAQVLLDRATSLAVYSAREFREQRLVRSGPPNPLHRTGITAQTNTPSFEDLFKPDWEGASPSQSPDSSISPAAYFLRLVLLARALETRAGDNLELIAFEKRRPDLTQLIIDATSMYQIMPTVTLVNEILESIIETHINTPESGTRSEAKPDLIVDDKMLETRFPHRSMPFEWYAQQYKLVLGKNKLSLGEVVRSIDRSAPYFKQPGARGDRSDIALHQSCNIGPQQQHLLTENFVIESGAVKFYEDNFGSTSTNLEDSVHFCAQTS
ncbi:MAG: Tc toxin subunit A, partial [Pseudomonadota bacterium]|nr:Tc toxin subunit A [Pseudomonadota bacterium]